MSRTGGHLSSNLGTVELTIALHYVFDTPRDRLVWDVGHQTYAHKILTGRRARHGEAAHGAASPAFPRRERERVRHLRHRALVDVDLARRWAWRSRRERKGEQRQVVAIIGDGAMTAGMAFEALNNAGAIDADLLVDPQRQRHVDLGAGRRAQQLPRAADLGRFYNAVRRGGKEVLSQASAGAASSPSAWEEHMKGMVLPGTLFEEFGFNYIGPIDGHDLDVLVQTLVNVSAARRARSSCTWSRARARATRWPRTIRSSTTA